MARLIDADSAIENIAQIARSDARQSRIGKIINMIEHMPTIEAEPVKHGRWKQTDETVWRAKEVDGEQNLELCIITAKCSVCERWSENVNDYSHRMIYRFCPYCGALMLDGGAENDSE